MDDCGDRGEDGVLSVRLELNLDRQPISGRLRTELGADEPFEGWLGFVETLQRLKDWRAPAARPDCGETTPRKRGDAPHGQSGR